MGSFKIVEPPAEEPVALEEAKAHVRLDSTTDDALLTSLIAAARLWAENYTRRSFIKQTWQLMLDDWPRDSLVVDLPRAPLIAINDVTLFDDDGEGMIWPAVNYFADTAREPGRLALKAGITWPVPSRKVNGIAIAFDAGYGENAGDVPAPIRLAVKQLTAHWYEHRGEAVVMSSTRHDAVANMGGVNVPLLIQALLDPFRILGLGV
jgi:uncharacterized phiE125 gp8 family phage protein